MTDATKIEINTDLAVRSYRALVSCLDELQAIHSIKYGNPSEVTHPVVRQKMDADDAVKNEAMPILIELHDFLDSVGISLISTTDENISNKGAE
jgi:hypothetical protein